METLGYVPKSLRRGYVNEYHKQVYRMRVELGLCYQCSKPAYEKDGKVFISCFYHYELFKERDKNKYQEMLKKKICTRCKRKKAIKDKKICKACAIKRRERDRRTRARKKEINECYRCSSSAVIWGYCANCYTKKRKGRKQQ